MDPLPSLVESIANLEIQVRVGRLASRSLIEKSAKALSESLNGCHRIINFLSFASACDKFGCFILKLIFQQDNQKPTQIED